MLIDGSFWCAWLRESTTLIVEAMFALKVNIVEHKQLTMVTHYFLVNKATQSTSTHWQLVWGAFSGCSWKEEERSTVCIYIIKYIHVKFCSVNCSLLRLLVLSSRSTSCKYMYLISNSNNTCVMRFFCSDTGISSCTEQNNFEIQCINIRKIEVKSILTSISWDKHLVLKTPVVYTYRFYNWRQKTRDNIKFNL